MVGLRAVVALYSDDMITPNYKHYYAFSAQNPESLVGDGYGSDDAEEINDVEGASQVA